MKIQYLAIIFLIIIIPMTLLLTMYNQAQINNLSLQLTYKSYLSDATHNAIKAFELNTVNNSYSEVADSLKRDVEAAANVFLSSMAKSLGTSGATNESVAEYVPAILFTLYDGYYIYAPSYNEILGEKTIQKESIDGTMKDVIVAVSKDQLDPPEKKEEDFSHIVKPYVYYTMRYVKGSTIDITVNYTLDNYISVYGKVGKDENGNDNYVTKSGYLVQIDAVNKRLSNGVEIQLDSEKLLTVLKRDILSYVLSPSEISKLDTSEEINDAFGRRNLEEIKSKINFGADGSYRVSLISDMGTKLLDDMLDGKYSGNNPKIDLADIPVAKIDEVFSSNGKNNIDDMKAVIDCFNVTYKGTVIEDKEAKSYYVKAYQFSNWVNTNLSNIGIQDARDSKNRVISDFSGNTAKIFKLSGGDEYNPEGIESIFSQHKIAVIKSSIQSSLTSAIARYNQSFFGLKHGYDLKMPVLNDLEWEAITNKVTMVTFMQGFVLGNKVFNDYAVVSSDTNKELVDENEIYYFNRNSTGVVYYHTYDCPNLEIEAEKADSKILGFKSAEFEMHKVKQDDDESSENDIKFQLGDELRRELFQTTTDDYGNEVITNIPNGFLIDRLLADYDCIVNRNHTSVNDVNSRIDFARIVALARERNVHYKVNGYLDSYKIEYKSGNIILTPSTTEDTNKNVTVSLSTDMRNIKYYTDADRTIRDWPTDENGDFGVVEIQQNTTIYAFSADASDVERSLPIANIDKTPPTGITIEASNISSSTFNLTVNAKDNDGSGISRYVVTVVDAANSEFRPYTETKYSSNETETISISSRARGTTYNCFVTVYDVAGNSRTSSTITVTTAN